ncbi:winged helix-turn-helix transcriptional regulator [Lactiplantibacillus carotarum]|uniref:winged helix-turn-helix transcriptional regulator n=1 Tax=Lactiplantibacillus carotarum TaxID=2993456 RepID=UPI00298EF0A4|nr:helix-turn-helix domain-containing protein [Lactiplantibacillus carotarum]
MQRYRYNCRPGCPVASTLQVISGKWKAVMIYQVLQQSVCRFHDFKDQFPGLTTRMLARQLNELVTDGIFEKQIYPVIPPKTEYRLTALGKSLAPLINEMVKWGELYHHQHPDLVER